MYVSYVSYHIADVLTLRGKAPQTRQTPFGFFVYMYIAFLKLSTFGL